MLVVSVTFLTECDSFLGAAAVQKCPAVASSPDEAGLAIYNFSIINKVADIKFTPVAQLVE